MNYHIRRIIGIVLMLITITSLIVLVFFRQDIEDYFRLRDYQAPTKIQRLVSDISFSDEGERLFFLGHPVLVTDAIEFNDSCDIDEFSIILGCFVDEENIYIYEVDDDRLDGIEEVTAAHEMLHNAYSRLSNEEKGEVDSMLLEAYKDIENVRLQETVKAYERADPFSVTNELHSLLGTEIRNLPSQLEQYYSQYFEDRSKVVDFAENYSSEFTSREKKVDKIDDQLTTLGSTIDSNQQRINDLQLQIQTKEQELNNFLDNDEIEKYNSEVPNFNVLVNQHNALVSETKTQISKYNSLVTKRNNLAIEVQDLVEAIDSTPEEIN